jgi:hypothetical protein
MRNALSVVCLFVALTLAGCAHLEFNATEEGLTYFEPKPYLAVAKGVDCKVTVTVLVLPGKQRNLVFHSGYGTADLSASLANGMLQSVGQKTDTKIPETITALTAGAAAMRSTRLPGETKETPCDAHVRLYPVVNGAPDFDQPLTVPEMH